MQIIKKRIADMNRAVYNPRVDLQPGDHEYESIKRSIQRHGLVQPIVWNRRTNTVVSGHQRLTVLEDLGETEADVSVVDLDEIAEKQLNIALNKIEGTWDDRKLSELLVELGDDATETGFTLPEIEVLQNELQSFFSEEEKKPDGAGEDQPKDFYLLTLQFDRADEKDLRAFIKKNGEDGIVGAILQRIKGD